jgi:leucyl/phenylalanyl-tRNA--protein transferase
MSIYELDKDFLWFPEADLWDKNDGIVAVGGDLNYRRLQKAYEKGIFPWNDPNSELLWWHPLERMVLRPNEVNVTKSSRNLLNQNKFEIRFNTAFKQVLMICQKIKRPDQYGTWITDDHINAFLKLHELGEAFSVEAWRDNKLVGGLYGIIVGSCFMGESMFSLESNAGKMAFIGLCRRLEKWGFRIIDCQIYNKYLASLGAYSIPRIRFVEELELARYENHDLEEVFSNET